MYEIQIPTISVHNLIIGTMYLDLGGKSIIKNLSNGEHCILEYHKKGWTGQGHRVDGEVFSSRKESVYKIDGRWTSQIHIINNKGEKELAWEKTPYHELCDRMYGMSHFMIQLNYFPK